MRILHLHSGNLFGGVESWMVTIAQTQSLLPEFQQEFALCFEGQLSSELSKIGMPIHDLGPVRVRHPFRVLAARRAVRKLLSERRYDAVMCHSPWSIALLAEAVENVPLIFRVRDCITGRSWLDRWALRRNPDLVLCNSRYTAQLVRPLFDGSVPIDYVHPAVSDVRPRIAPGDRDRIRQELGAGEKDTVILQLSRMEAFKGYELHMEALGRLREVPDWQVWFAGGTPREADRAMAGRLETRACELGIRDRVRFLGHRTDAPALLAAADIHCQPNVSPEPFGQTWVQALWASLPIITTAMGGALEIVEPDCGLLVRPEAGALASALERWIRNPEERRRYGRNGPARAFHLSDPVTQMRREMTTCEQAVTRKPARSQCLRVLHLHSGNLYGGVETLLTTLERERALCPQLQHEFALCFEGRFSRELLALGSIVHPLEPARARYLNSVLRVRRKVQSLLRERNFDAVICHSAWSLALLAGPVRSIPLVYWVHDHLRSGQWLQRWAGRRSPDLIIVNSNFTAQTTRQVVTSPRSAIIYYPLASRGSDLRRQGRARKRLELGVTEDQVVILQVSRMEPYKGHRLHIESLAHVKHLPHWVCWFVGGAQRPFEAEYLAELRALAESLGIADRVRFLGQRSDVPELLCAADIHCQPNAGPEPFGITHVEALIAGLPVVSTNIGAAPEIITDECGILVEPGNPELLGAALRRLIESPELRSRLGAAGPARARELCDPGHAIARLHQILLETSGKGAA